MNALSRTVACLSLAIAAVPAAAQRIALDELPGSRQTHAVELGWDPSLISGAIATLLSGARDAEIPMTGRLGGVEVRLDTADYAGQDARIYLTLPASVAGLANPEELELRWEAAGRFLSGAARPGQSTLIFEGTIEQAVTTAVFSFALLLTSSLENDTFELEPFYELESAL